MRDVRPQANEEGFPPNSENFPEHERIRIDEHNLGVIATGLGAMLGPGWKIIPGQGVSAAEVYRRATKNGFRALFRLTPGSLGRRQP